MAGSRSPGAGALGIGLLPLVFLTLMVLAPLARLGFAARHACRDGR
jgi:hypothetical protein